MINWNTDEEAFKKKSPEKYKLWRLIQLINHGPDGEKLSEEEVRNAWPKIKNSLKPDKKKMIEFYLWDKKWQKEPGLLPNRSNYWIWHYQKATS